MRLLLGVILLAALAAPARAAAEGTCAKATAVRVATQLHFGTEVAHKPPVGQVLCGAFTGPGSQAMAVSIDLPSCGGNSIEWAVFALRGGRWRLVMKRPNGAILSKAAAGIRERVGVPKAGDPPCSPSAWKTRTWSWNGARFVASAWKTTSAVSHVTNFLSPDRRVWCTLGDVAFCATMTPGHSAELHADGSLVTCDASAATGPCVQNWDDAAPSLHAGITAESHGFDCTPVTGGIACTLAATGTGFAITPAGVTRINP